MTNIQDTSLLAYWNDVIPYLPKSQQIVLEEILKHPEGITNAEISEIIRKPINTVTPRCLELRTKKLVIGIGRRRCKSTGQLAIIWGYNRDYDLEHSHLKESAKERIKKLRYQPSLI